jgi:autotransporter-associated beta strand protein
MGLLLAAQLVRGQWIKSGTDPYYYDDLPNWLGGVANGQFTSSVNSTLTVVVREGVVLPSGTSFYLTLGKTNGNILFKGEGLNSPLRLNGSVVTALNSGNRLFAFGSLKPGGELAIDLGQSDRIFNVANGDTVQLINGVSSSAGVYGLIKQGSGTLELWDDNNSFSGGIQVQAGKLIFSSIGRVGEGSALGNPLTVADGIIRAGGGSSSAVQLQFGGANGEVKSDSLSDRIICWLGTETSYTLENQSGHQLILTGDFQNQATGSTPAQLVISGKNDSATEIRGIIGDVGASRSTSLSANGQNNAGTPYVLRLSGTANTFSGAVATGYNTILEVVKLADRGFASSLGTGLSNPLISIGGTGSTYGSTLRYIGGDDASTDRPISLQFRNNSTNIIANDSSANANLNFTNISSWVVAKSGSTGNNTLSLRGSSTGTSTIAGRIVDEGLNAANKTSLTVNSSGVWRLTNDNSYSGSTTILAGTLLIDEALSKTSTLQVSGGVLAGSGSINPAAAVGVSGGAVLSPGGDGVVGTLTMGSLLMQNDSIYRIDLNSDLESVDLVLALGAVVLGNRGCMLVLQDFGNSVLEVGRTFTILHSTTGISGNFAGELWQVGQNCFELDYTVQEVRLIVVPELGGRALLLIGFSLLLLVRLICGKRRL